MSHADLRSLRLLAILILVTSLLSSAADVQSEASRNVHWELKRVARAYNIFVFTATPYFPDRATHGRVVGKVDGKKASRKTLESYAGVFAREFSLYPGVLVVRMGLKGVVLCEELTVDGHSVGGFADFDRLNVGFVLPLAIGKNGPCGHGDTDRDRACSQHFCRQQELSLFLVAEGCRRGLLGERPRDRQEKGCRDENVLLDKLSPLHFRTSNF